MRVQENEDFFLETSASVSPAKQLHSPADLNAALANQLKKKTDIGKSQ